MAQFKVLPVQAGTGENELGQVARLLEEANSQVQRVYLGLSFQIRCREQVDESLRRSMARLERQQEDAGRLSSGIRQAMERYQACEGAVLLCYEGGVTVGAAAPSSGSAGINWGDVILDMLGTLGNAGSSVLDVWAEYLTDTRETLDSIDSIKAGRYAKWAGFLIGLVANFAGNVQEFAGDFSDPRLYLETVSETAVSAGASALVGAGIAAIFVSAPAWAVGAAATVIVFSVDQAVEYLTGESLTEHISDFVLNTGAAIADSIGTAWESVMELF